jgi:hypothetical protein
VRKGSDLRVRGFAAVSLPMLEVHLVLSEQTAAAVDRMGGRQQRNGGSGQSST